MGGRRLSTGGGGGEWPAGPAASTLSSQCGLALTGVLLPRPRGEQGLELSGGGGGAFILWCLKFSAKLSPFYSHKYACGDIIWAELRLSVVDLCDHCLEHIWENKKKSNC